ncbi:flap endonuclease GEN-like 1 [Glycine soja]|uniref:Flap endonuclease GEN-like 1 n=1 Tax=Glycine soja TaxID=3848 RepID=A0A445J6I0_GLYSO|nr:flap endonuclease GEN-like 1 [Glycine soja]KHN29400.1 Flap endonuclease GEN-like 1 [Glycine soja]RZB94002.1 Flap endonuclease GEN-like 1 isoform A [Glycine soja]
MGVGGNFWDLLKPYARKEGFDFLRNKRVAVDLSFWIVQPENAIKAMHVRKPHLRLTFFRTISLFCKFGALPVFIVDGSPSLLKSRARIARYFRCSGIELANLPVPEEGVSAERNRLFSSHVQECAELVELLGMPVLKAKGEAEALCAQLNSEGHVDACITADSDAFLFGAKCIIKCFCPNSKEPFECYNMSDIEAGLGLKRKHLIAISLLVGDDHDINGVRGIGLDTALHFVKAFSEDDILNRLHEIGKGNTSQIPICIKVEDNVDGNSPNRKLSHCSFCGHPGSKKDHMKFPCEYCVTKDDEGCQRKPEDFKCDCFSCDMNRKHKEKKRLENQHTIFFHKIAEEPNFPKDEIIDMYLCNDNGYFSASDSPHIVWGNPNIEMLINFLNFHQHWEPAYVRRMMFPMMSTIFLRDMTTTTVETTLFGQYEFDSVERVKMRYGYQFFVVKWKRAGVNISCKVPLKESSVQQDDAIELDEMVDLLDDFDAPEIHGDDGCSFLLTDENMDLVGAAFPAEVKRFWQEQELKRIKNSTSRSQENEKSSSPNSRSIQLNITEFYPSTKVKHRQSKQGEESSKNADSQGNGGSKMKRKMSSPDKIPKSARRRLLFD